MQADENLNWCSGDGQFDTRIKVLRNGTDNTREKAGQSYDVYSLQDYVRDMRKPPVVAKGEGRWIIPSHYRQPDARSHDTQRQSGKFTAICFDADQGNYSLEQFENAIVQELGDVERYINSSASSKVNNRKWHCLVPLEEALIGGGYAATYEVLLERFAARGIKLDAALARTAQLFYTPATVDAQDSDWQTRIVEDKPRWNIRGTSLERDAEVKLAAWLSRNESAALARGQAKHSGSMIDWFNNLFTTETLLEEFGYTTDGREWASPRQQASGSRCSTKVRPDGSFVSMSASDGMDGPGMAPRDGKAQRSGDAFDLFTYFRFGNDPTAARNYIRPLHKFHIPNGYFRSCSQFEAWGTAGNKALAETKASITALVAKLQQPTVELPTDIFDFPPISDDEWSNSRLTPRVIVENYMFADVQLLVAAGGVGKTTLSMFEAIHIVLGLPVWGNEVKAPGVVVLMTAEDSREQIVARLRRICQEMHLTEEQIHAVRNRVLIKYVGGTDFRLTQVDKDVVKLAPEVVKLTDALVSIQPALVIVDPVVSFGVGEQRVNDAEQGLITASRYIRDKLDCCVRLVHHTGKANARNETRDQYSSRGGSALPDGSRMMHMLSPLSKDKWQDRTGLQPNDEEDASYLELHPGKHTYVSPSKARTIYVKRTGYTYAAVDAIASPLDQLGEEQIALICDAVRKAQATGEGAMRISAQSDNWLGFYIAEVLGEDVGEGLKATELDKSQKDTRERIRKIIKKLIDDKVLKKGKYTDSHGKEKPILEVP